MIRLAYVLLTKQNSVNSLVRGEFVRNSEESIVNGINIQFYFVTCSHTDYIDARGQTARLTTAHQRSIANFKIKMQMFTEFNAHMREKLKDSNHYKFLCRYNNQSGPTVHSWFTTAESIVMYLTNGIVQVCRKTRII